MTFVELDRAQWAHIRQQQDIGRNLIRGAWWTEYFARHKTLPNLTILLTPARPLEGDELKAREEEHQRLVEKMER